MRKKLTMLLASLFLVLGTAWAQIPTASTAPAEGQWNADTRWYTIQCNDGSKGYISLLHADVNGNLMLNNGGKPTGTQGLWCVVGDDTNGYQFYNYAGGASKVLGATGSDGSDRMKLYDAGGNENGVTYKFDIKKLDDEDGYAFVRQKDSENQWWNNRDDYLSYWNSSNAYGAGCSGSQYIFTEVNIAEFVADYKASAIAALNSFASFATVTEAVSAIEAISVANLADLTAIDEKMEEVYEGIGYLAFRNSDVNQAAATRINAYLATRANREKGHGTNVTANWPNFVWSLKYAGGSAFYLYNAVHELYLGSPSSNGAFSATPTAAYAFEVITDEDVKKFEFKCGNQTLHLNNHTDGMLSNHDNNDPASRWYVETNLTDRLAEFKGVSASLLTDAKPLAESAELATFGRIADLKSAVTDAESSDLVVAGKAYFELGTLNPIAAQYKEAIIAFNLTPGKLYALRESTSGLYLDIQTKGIHEPKNTTNSISLNAIPCAIYLEAGGGVSTWKMKSAAGKYAQQAGGRNWNAVIGTTAYEWTFSAPAADLHTIARADGKFINVDTKEAGQPLYCDKDAGMEFEIVEFPMNKIDGIYALKSSTDTYLNFTTKSSSAVSFQSAPSYLYMIPSANAFAFQSIEDEKKFIGSTHSWNATTDFSVWNISEPENNLVAITRVDDANQYLGSNTNTDTNTGIFTNVPSNCNRWILEKYYPLTIKYMLGGEELAELRVESVVKPGTEYTIEDRTEHAGWVISSCMIGENEVEAIEGGAYAITVNAATEVVVTLEAVVSNARPVYTLKSAAGTYLGLTPKAEGIVADGVYTIKGDNNGIRGFLVAGEGYAGRPVLSDITYTGCTGNSVAAIANGKNWYVYTTAVGTYIYNIGLGKFLANEWNLICFSDVPYAWNIKQNGNYTSIYDNAMAKYLSMACGTSPTNENDRIVKWDTNKDDGGAQHTFTVVTEGDYATQIAAAKAAIDKVSVSFQETPLQLYYTATADGAVFEYKDEPGKYLGFEEWGWNVVNERSAWTIQPVDFEGLAHIVRATETTKCLGSSVNTNVGTGIYSNVESGCNKWMLEGVYENYATTTEVRDSKRHFTSEKLPYAGACNILRFTLTQSAAYYENAKTNKRMSFDSFVLYDANGHAVELTAENFTGNNAGKDFSKMLDGVNGQCCAGTWGQANAEDDWFEITLPSSVDLGGAFSFSFVTENAAMDAQAFDISMRYKSNDHKLSIVAPYGYDVTATYNDEPIADGGIIRGEFDEELLEISDIDGYAWSVTVEKGLVTVTFVQVEAIVNPASVVALINRVGGAGTANNFKFVLDPTIDPDGETFVIGAEDSKILIKGSTLSALTTGLGWYLNNIAHINIAWNSLNEKTTTVRWNEYAGYADLSNLPLPSQTETHTSDAKYRYYLNTCTFGYSMTSWTWTRWQQEIDWMALHGINMPLQLVGLEEVWRTFLTMEDANGNRKYGYTDEEAKAFVAGPAFIAWWAMNNLEGWGGTAAGSKSGYNNLAGAGGVQDDAWYARQKKLAKQIVDAQRGLGMQPVIPGWSGMVPTNFAAKSTYATRYNGKNWAGDFVRPLLLNTSVGKDKYAEIAADYYKCLHAVMGESQYYSMDPFHEGGGEGTMADYEYMYAAMEAAKPGSQWVIQQWQWSETQKYSLTAVPEGRLIVLDLFSDGSPAFDGYNGYAPQEAVFCAIPNFGGRSGLMGRLQNLTDNYFKFKGQYESIKGIGAAPEAIEQTPVTYDLIFQLPWMNGVKPDVAEWVDNYAVARYGKDNSVVKEAWSLLRQGPLNYGADGIQGPVEDVWAARPNLDANKASSWGKTLADAGGTYTPARRQMLIDAVYKLIDQEDELELENGSVYKSNYMYDLVEFGGAVMADYAYDLLLGIKAAKNAAGNNFATDATYIARRDAFLQLILDMDAFRGTNLNFRLGKWTQEARDAATEVEGASTATPDWYEYNNARTILSTWSSPSTNLTDYSYRSWQGLLKDYYYKRWKYYFDNNCNGGQYEYFEWNWAHGKEHYVGQTGFSNVDLTADQDGHTSKYTREPVGNTVEEAVKMLGKYIIPVAMADGTHYAYRYLTNDLSSKVTIIAMGGTTIDLTKYFGALEGATVTGEFIDGEVTDLANIAVKSDLTEEAYTGTITLADGTVLTFGVSANPKYYGAYQIKYNDEPVFIQYNVGGDNSGSVGYKVMGATGYGENGNAVSTGLTADYEADKIFTIVPSGIGYSLSAQGQYLKTTASSGWAHIMFSDQKGDAGTYVFTDATNSLVTLKSTANTDKASVAIFGNGAWGNDVDGKARQFAIEKVENYAVTIPESGYLAVCLPFNVVLPDGVTAYDVTVEGLTSGDDGAVTTLDTIAVETEILKAGTPTLLKATANTTYNLTITMDNTDAKTPSPESKLRGNFVKQTLQPGTNGLSKFVLDAATGKFKLLDAEQEIPANTCWIEAKIDAELVEITEHKGKIVKVDDWLFEYEDASNGIKLKDVATPGDGNLEIKETFTINGKTQKVVAITPDFLQDNKDVTEITLPSSLVNLGFRKVIPMFETSYEGEKGDTAIYKGETTEVVSSQGMHRCLVFPEDPDSDTGAPFKVSKDFAWKLTLDVTIDRDSLSYNQWGSSIVSTYENSLADSYSGFMQIYMWKDLQHIVVKIDNADDRYSYSTEALDEDGNVLKTVNGADSLLVNRHFRFELEHDGSGGYQVVIYYDNGKAKMYNITASENNKVGDFDRLYYSLPEGIHVNVKFEKLTNEGLFVGCTNLKAIHVHPDNPTFSSCDHGVLYDKNKYYVMRIPEGLGEVGNDGRRHYEIPSKVVRLYPGSIHGVSADIVLHSNPEIGVVAGHEEHVKNAKFFLSLDDKDNTITEKETGYGGARDFISTNKNTYQSGRYKRAPLEEGKYGTIVLPFSPTNWKEKYDFFIMTDADATSFHFSPVDELQPNTAYLYKLKDGVEPDGEEMDMEGDTLDVFETVDTFTVQTHAKYNPTDETPGDFRALGAYVNYYIDTEAANKKNGSFYYYYSISQEKFLKVTKKLTYRPYRALFVVTPEKGQAAQAPAQLSLQIRKGNGETTEIDPSEVEGMETPIYYDLQGRRVLNPTQGIYIVNGKKVVIE